MSKKQTQIDLSNPLPLISLFSVIEDPRVDRHKRYPLQNILFFAFVAILADQQSWYQIHSFTKDNLQWFADFVDISAGVPSHDTFQRVFSLLQPTVLEDILIQWVEKIREKSGSSLRVIAVDGKSLRGVPWKLSDDKVHTLNAWDVNKSLCIATKKVDDKTNEITAAPKLIEKLDVRGAVISADALLTQKAIAQQIVDQSGFYFLALKGNHPVLFEEAKLYFETQHQGQHAWRTLEKNRGYVEERMCLVSGETTGWESLAEWPNLKAVVQLRSERSINGKTTVDTRYFITNLSAGAATYQSISRSHWGVENKLHRSLDVLFLEDACQVHNTTTAANLSVMRKLALGLLKGVLPKRSLVSKRKKAAYDPLFRRQLLTGEI